LATTVPGTDENLSALDPDNFKRMIGKVVQDFFLKVVATTFTESDHGTRNDWALFATPKELIISAQSGEFGIFGSRRRRGFVRVGLIYGFLAGKRSTMGR